MPIVKSMALPMAFQDGLSIATVDICLEYRGPLPSIHEGSTAGFYYLPPNPDRGAMGADSKIWPTLLERKAAPEIVPILENGVTYHVFFDKDLSTWMFLDQRLHRAWWTRNCNENTHVLNYFACFGAFSIAAAAAGASTISLDLKKKWLDWVLPEVDFDERHDCILGDCFEWLEKLAHWGEKYDVVILDPPNSSFGKKEKWWSVKNDMDELVALAAPLVKKGGLL
jgi:23S rRNA G2069 N7-methylase RlmK/C1962 C5-methylase RlmI